MDSQGRWSLAFILKRQFERRRLFSARRHQNFSLATAAHGAFVSDEEVHRVVSYLKTQGEPDYIEGVLEGGTTDGEDTGYVDSGDVEKDPMYDQAVEVVLKNRKASISLVQRHLKIGYNRAARLVEEMEKAGLVSAMSSNGQREILVPARAE